MDYPKRSEALEILSEAEKLNPGPWVMHSKVVAHCAEAIANECYGMDGEKAYVLGLLHDVGRRAGKGQLKIDYPAITLVLWYFYIGFLYGALNIKIFGWPKDSFLFNAQWRGHEK